MAADRDAEPPSHAGRRPLPEVLHAQGAQPQGVALRTAEREVLHAPLQADRAIARLAARQYGVVARQQLRAAGLGRGAIAHRVAHGRLHRLHRAVYVVGHPVLAPLAREMAAVLACAPRAFLSHRPGAALWGLVAHVDLMEVTVAGRQIASRPGIRVHCVAALDRRDVRMCKSIPVTAPARTLLDLAAFVPRRDLERALDEARVRRLVTDADLIATIARGTHSRGAAILRQLVQHHAAATLTRSEAEDRLLALIRAARLPAPLVNARVAGHEVDFLWPAHRLVVEVDGYAFHSSRGAFERDRVRDADLQAAAFRVVRFTWRRIVDEPEAVLARLAGLLATADPPTLRF